MKIEKTLGKLEDNNLEIFRKLRHCLKAARFCIDVVSDSYDNEKIKLATARDFIKEILFEIEIRKNLEHNIWTKLKKSYELSDDEFKRLHIDEDSGEISILTKEYFEKSYNGEIDLKKFNLVWNN